jgi:transmembrane sensor
MSAQKLTAEREAVVWHVRLQSEDASEQDWLQFEAWMANPLNKAAFEALEAAINTVETHRQRFVQLRDDEARARVRARPRASVWSVAMAGAALVAIGLAVSIPEQSQEFAYAASTAAPRSVTLADNTLVRLNRGASLRVRLRPHAREIVLERGEASFAVHHDAARPFSVAAGGARFVDVGTEFNVVHAPAYVRVTVREGEVSMHVGKTRALHLVAGQEARLDAGRVTIAATNPDDAFGWQSGRLIYRRALLSHIVEDLNRYSPKPVVVADPAAARLLFTGVIEIDEPAAMLQRLEDFLPIQSTQGDDRIVVTARP